MTSPLLCSRQDGFLCALFHAVTIAIILATLLLEGVSGCEVGIVAFVCAVLALSIVSLLDWFRMWYTDDGTPRWVKLRCVALGMSILGVQPFLWRHPTCKERNPSVYNLAVVLLCISAFGIVIMCFICFACRWLGEQQREQQTVLATPDQVRALSGSALIDAAMQLLASRAHSREKVVLSAADLDQHPIRAADGVDTEKTCAICLETFVPGDMIRTLNYCCHSYHKACIDPWLLHEDARCPVCRTGRCDAAIPSSV